MTIGMRRKPKIFVGIVEVFFFLINQSINQSINWFILCSIQTIKQNEQLKLLGSVGIFLYKQTVVITAAFRVTSTKQCWINDSQPRRAPGLQISPALIRRKQAALKQPNELQVVDTFTSSFRSRFGVARAVLASLLYEDTRIYFGSV